MVNSLVKVVNMKVTHLDLVLDDMALFDQVWLKKSQSQRGKEGIMLKITHMTIITCEMVLRFPLI
jgi:hypothetical protein